MPVQRSSTDLRALDRRIIALAVPALGALIVEPVYELTDTAVVGHLGRSPLVGLALAATILNVVGWSAGFLTMATTSRIAFLRGRGDAGGVAAVVHAAYAVAAALGVLLGVLVVIFGREAAVLLGGSGAGLDAATTYLRISALGLPFLLLALAGAGHLQGLEDTPDTVSDSCRLEPRQLGARARTGLWPAHWHRRVGLGHGDRAGRVGRDVRRRVSSADRSRDPRCRRRGPPVAAGRRSDRGADRGAGRSDHGVCGDCCPRRWSDVGGSSNHRSGVAVPGVDRRRARRACAGFRRSGAGRSRGRLGLRRRGSLPADRIRPRGRVDGGDLRTSAGAAVHLHVRCAGPARGDDRIVHLRAQQVSAAGAFVLDGLLLGASDYRTLRRTMLLSLIAYAPFAVATLIDPRLGIAGVWLALTCWLAARPRCWADGGSHGNGPSFPPDDGGSTGPRFAGARRDRAERVARRIHGSAADRLNLPGNAGEGDRAAWPLLHRPHPLHPPRARVPRPVASRRGAAHPDGAGAAAAGFPDQIGLWGNLGVSLLGFTGAIFVLQPLGDGTPTMSLLAALIAVVLGTVLGTLALALSAVPGARTGAPAMVLLRGLFGARVSYLPTGLNIVQCLGWGIFEIVTIAAAAKTVAPSVQMPFRHASLLWSWCCS